MNINNINKLLEKYWEAETTLEEEKILSDYFHSSEIAPEHKDFAPMFQTFADMAAISLEEKKSLEAKEEAKVIGFSPWKNWRVIGIAASLVFLLSIGIMNIDQFNIGAEYSYAGKYTEITEEEEALEMTKEALAYLGAKFEKSSRTINHNFKEMEAVAIIK